MISKIEQLQLFSVADYSYKESRFGTVEVAGGNLLTGTDIEPTPKIPVSKSNKIPVSKLPKLKRDKGLGTGRIIFKETTITKNGKEYHYNQPWFAWEEWQNGTCQMRSKYIPKKLSDRIIAMNAEKLPVADILQVLGVVVKIDL